jgi:hypothetical protein
LYLWANLYFLTRIPNAQLMEDLKALGYPEWDNEARYCRDVCKAESK